MTEWAILFERDVLFISSVVTRLTCPGRGEVHQWSPCHNARRKLGLTGGACANPVCDHPGLVTISNFSHFFLASAELSVSLNQPKYAIRNTLEVSLLLCSIHVFVYKYYFQKRQTVGLNGLKRQIK